ncbi:MAG: hypothetical protein LBI67_07340 [Treponema sp.]|jgi:hypothetical protein|nr:hypothetical protein [Treponema sp.]
MDYKKIFERFDDQNGFVKTTFGTEINVTQKAALNRRGNVLFNSGRIEEACRIFLTTGYSDGISRVGDCYKSQGRVLEALRMYWMAPDRTKAEPIIMQLSEIIRHFIHEE